MILIVCLKRNLIAIDFTIFKLSYLLHIIAFF